MVRPTPAPRMRNRLAHEPDSFASSSIYLWNIRFRRSSAHGSWGDWTESVKPHQAHGPQHSRGPVFRDCRRVGAGSSPTVTSAPRCRTWSTALALAAVWLRRRARLRVRGGGALRRRSGSPSAGPNCRWPSAAARDQLCVGPTGLARSPTCGSRTRCERLCRRVRRLETREQNSPVSSPTLQPPGLGTGSRSNWSTATLSYLDSPRFIWHRPASMVQAYPVHRERAGLLILPAGTDGGPTIVELCALWAVHLHFDPSPEPWSIVQPGVIDAIAATAELVVRANYSFSPTRLQPKGRPHAPHTSGPTASSQAARPTGVRPPTGILDLASRDRRRQSHAVELLRPGPGERSALSRPNLCCSSAGAQ